MRRAGDVARCGRRIERQLGEKLLARGELLRNPLELQQVARARVSLVIHPLEMRLEPAPHQCNLSLPRTFWHGELQHQGFKRHPRFGQAGPAFALGASAAKWSRELMKARPGMSRQLESQQQALCCR